MATILSENFDSVTAPNLPSTVTAVNSANNTMVTSVNQYVSSPNGIVGQNAGTVNGTIYSNAADSTSGNSTVTSSVRAVNVITGMNSGVMLGVGGQWLFGAANDNSYVCYVTPSALVLARDNLGVPTSLGTTTGNAGFLENAWYRVSMSRNGSVLKANCSRLSDGQWLAGNGTWSLVKTDAISVTDSSPLASTGSYGGMLLDGPWSYYGDDLLFEDLAGTIQTVSLSSSGQTHYGAAPNNVGEFIGKFSYHNISATQGRILIDIQNITDSMIHGSIVAFAWNTPTAGSPTISSLSVVYNNTGLDLINTAPSAFDCLDATTGFGNATMGLAIRSSEGAVPTRTWNCAGVISHGPRSGLRSWQKGTIILALSGTNMDQLQASSFSAIASSGANGNWFPVHFRWLNDTGITTTGTVGDDYVGSA